MITGEKPTKVTILAFIGGILILFNALSFASNRAPLIWSAGTIKPENLTTPEQPLWWRLSLGYRGLTDLTPILVLLLSAVIIIFSALGLLMKPKFHGAFGYIMIACSVISLACGGGFIIGVILAFGAGLMAIEYPKKFEETFFGRIYSAARLDSKFYKSIANDPAVSKKAVLTLMFVNLLSGLGIGLYAYNAGLTTNIQTNLPQVILLLGEMRWDVSIIVPPLAFMGLAIIKWIMLSVLIYVVTVSIIGLKTEGEKIARVVAFAYVPISLQFFIPFVFTNGPYKVVWPLTIFFITNIWMILALTLGLKEALETNLSKTFGIVASAGSIYYLINYFMFIKEPTAFKIAQTINVLIYPEELIFIGVFVAVSIAVLMGTFSRR